MFPTGKKSLACAVPRITLCPPPPRLDNSSFAAALCLAAAAEASSVEDHDHFLASSIFDGASGRFCDAAFLIAGSRQDRQVPSHTAVARETRATGRCLTSVGDSTITRQPSITATPLADSLHLSLPTARHATHSVRRRSDTLRDLTSTLHFTSPRSHLSLDYHGRPSVITLVDLRVAHVEHTHCLNGQQSGSDIKIHLRSPSTSAFLDSPTSWCSGEVQRPRACRLRLQTRS